MRNWYFPPPVLYIHTHIHKYMYMWVSEYSNKGNNGKWSQIFTTRTASNKILGFEFILPEISHFYFYFINRHPLLCNGVINNKFETKFHEHLEDDNLQIKIPNHKTSHSNLPQLKIKAMPPLNQTIAFQRLSILSLLFILCYAKSGTGSHRFYYNASSMIHWCLRDLKGLKPFTVHLIQHFIERFV